MHLRRLVYFAFNFIRLILLPPKDFPVFHYKNNSGHTRNIFQEIPVNSNNICKFFFGHEAQLILYGLTA
jgi:hypothetical protein